MTAPSDPGTAAVSAIGAAQVHDERFKTNVPALTRGLVAALTRAGVRCTAAEAADAVNRFYELDETADQMSPDAFVHNVRRVKMRVVQDTAKLIESHEMSPGQKRAWEADKATIRAWECPDCGALPDTRCINQATGDLTGEWFAGHPGRIRLALGQPARRHTA